MELRDCSPDNLGTDRDSSANNASVSDHRLTKWKVGTMNVKKMPVRKKVRVIYFARAATGQIKIGSTGYMEDRLAGLRGQSPVAIDLLLVIPGDRRREFQYHAQFAPHRLHGEWFDPHPDIIAEITRLRSNSMVPRLPAGVA